MSSLESSLVGCLAANQIAFAKPEYNGTRFGTRKRFPNTFRCHMQRKLVPLASLRIYVDALCMSST